MGALQTCPFAGPQDASGGKVGRMAAMSKDGGWRAARMATVVGACMIAAAFSGCLEPPWAGPFPERKPEELVQEGTVVVRDGEEAKVSFKKAFQTPPRVEMTGFVQSWFKDEPYSKKSFEIVDTTGVGCTIRTSHHEQGRGSFAEIKWKATGIKAPKKTLAEMTPQERVVAQVEKLGGKVKMDDKVKGAPLIGIDLHQTRTRDADLAMLHGLTGLKTLNLFGTSITDAGLAHLDGLTGLQTLHLNGTAITDAGLEKLRSLTALRELSLYGTKVTDDGLRHLAVLTNLQTLSLGGRQISDKGMQHLLGLKELHQISLSGTSVTEAEVKELQRHWPRLQVIR
jgi:hypothetical protein